MTKTITTFVYELYLQTKKEKTKKNARIFGPDANQRRAENYK